MTQVHSSMLSLDDLSFVGCGLVRPECVLATAAGHLYSADWRGGVAHILPDGTQHLYTGVAPDGRQLRPNGIALLPDGSFLVADLGETLGGVFRLERSGKVSTVLEQIDGTPLPPTNFVTTDIAGRIWVTVSTRKSPRSLAYRPDADDGFIIRINTDGSACVVADGLGYTNELAFSPCGKWLYVNETFSRCLSRFAVNQAGDLGDRQLVCRFGAGTFPDGLAFDEEGGIWITSIVSNRVLRVVPGSSVVTVLADSDFAHVNKVEMAFQAGELGRPHLDQVKSQRLRNISSLAFGGPDLTDGYLGCLLGDAIAHIRLPVRGHPPIHWHYDDQEQSQ